MFTLKSPTLNITGAIDAELTTHPVLTAAITQSPYLGRLCRMRPETVRRIEAGEAARCVADAIETARDIPDDTPHADAKRILRQAKADIHLSLATLDLSCEWDWVPVTRSFSEFADAATETALRLCCYQAAQSGWIEWKDQTKPLPGLFILALGKLGAYELNYSSDIDIVAMFDPDIFPSAARQPGDAARRIIQAMAKMLEDQTEHGYVLRVDLRLRPDPRSTSVAVSVHSAEAYYENVGQNWERMAYIKARACAGDDKAAHDFLKTMVPFVWRRHLDFWALEDIRAIKQQIHSTGGHQGLDDVEFDVKLGRGGIREIEFFAQTQQLIHGGRNPDLRHLRTIETLRALAAAGHITDETAIELSDVYAELRGIEHRIQMLNDAHTHTLPDREDTRLRVAKLCGYSDLVTFDADVRSLRETVRKHYSELFRSPDDIEGGIEGNLVFTGVDIDPGTVKTLSDLGFSNPESIIADFQAWHRGSIRATRTTRGQQLLTALEPRLFQHMSETGNPDAAYQGLKTFLGGLSAGIQTLSLLAANPVILDDLINMFAMAPQLARDLGSRPNLLESLLDGGFTDDLSEDTCGHFEAIAEVGETDAFDFEGAMNEVRRNFRDAHFRIRFKMLNDVSVWPDVGHCFSDLADGCIRALVPVALREAERKLGPAPGKWVICGLGKLGSRDLTANSDLDMMVIFESDASELGAPQFFARATQRLITALSAQTEEGLLYEADMQLRPSGRAGPVAVKLSAFADYYRNDAWTWEHMALTRLRAIAGDADLIAKVMAEKQALLSIPRPAEKIIADAWDMRDRLLRERPAAHEFDVKLIKGGMIDVEFLVQTVQLLKPDFHWDGRTVDTVLKQVPETGLLSVGEAETLQQAYRLYRGILTYQRAALETARPADEWPGTLKRLMAKALSVADFDKIHEQVQSSERDVWDIVCRKLQPGSTEWL